MTSAGKDLSGIIKQVAQDTETGLRRAGTSIKRHFSETGDGLEASASASEHAESQAAAGVKRLRIDSPESEHGGHGSASEGHGGGDHGEPEPGPSTGPGTGGHGGGANPEAQDANPRGEGGSGGDPVDVVTGESYLAQRDLVLPGVLPLVLGRRFASGYRAGRLFGSRWASDLDQRLEIDDDGVAFITDDGRVLRYPVPGPDGLSAWPSFGPRWPLAADRSGQLRIEQGESGRTLVFSAGPGQRRALVSVTDRAGNSYAFDYDEHGTPVGIRHSGGYHVRLASRATAGGTRVTAITLADPGGGEDHPVREFGYDEAGRLAEVYDPDSPLPLVFAYDQADRMTRWTDRNGYWCRYAYRQDGRVARTTGRDGYLDTAFSYDLDGRATTVTDALGRISVYHWNDLGQTVRAVNPLGGERRTEQDPYGNVLSTTDEIGRVTRIDRDPMGDPVRIIYPDGTASVVEYDDRRLPARAALEDGRSWTYEHGPHGQVTAITDPVGAVARFAYDDRGRPAADTDPLGAATAYRSDPAGELVEITDPLGAVTSIRRDAFGRVTETTDPAGASTRYEWSPGGRLSRVLYPDGATERWEYDPEGNVVSGTSPTGAVTTLRYGPFDLPVARTDPDGGTYAFAYDQALNLTAVTGPTGLTWTYEYDDANRLIAETSFDGVRADYTLDPAGQLTARTGPGGRVEFERDAAGSVVERRAGGQVTRFAYGVAGQLRHAESPGCVLDCTFDALGRVLTETVNGRTVTSEYDAAGRRVGRVTPSGVRTRWTFDAAGQPTALTGTAGTLGFAYDQAGNETSRVLGPGARTGRGYGAVGQVLTETVWAYPGHDVGDPGPGAAATEIQTRAYDYRPDGSPAEIRDALRGTRRFSYDAAGRVTRVRAESWEAAYAYDALGSISARSDPLGEQESSVPRRINGTRTGRARRTSYAYDAAGRMVSRTRRTPSGQARTWTFDWDSEDRLTRVSLPGGDSWHYSYDPLGRRIAKTRHDADGTPTGETVRFDWDGPRLAEETTTGPDGGESVRTWDYEPGEFTPVAQTRRDFAADAPQAEIDAEFHAIVTDLVGTPAELVTPDGELAWHTTTSLWGQTVPAPDSTADCPLRFPGQYHDAETGLHYNLNRYYDPELGAYLSPDPLGLAPSPNPTAYVANPLIEYDPLGLYSSLSGMADDVANKRGEYGLNSVADEDKAANSYKPKKPPSGTKNTVGKMEFDGGRDPVYGRSGRNERSGAYPGKGQGIAKTSWEDHAEGDMVHQATQKGYSGGNAIMYTDRKTCTFCKNSMMGYVRHLNLDSLSVYHPGGLTGIWNKDGKIP